MREEIQKMVNVEYANAYSEVLEVLNHISKSDYDKIPNDMIEFFNRNNNKEYEFNYDVTKTLNEQNVSKIAKTIIAILFRDYWATDYQKARIIEKEKQDREALERQKREKYNPNDIFRNRKTNTNDNDINQDIQEQLNEEYNQNLPMEVQIQNIFQRLLNFIKKLIHMKE